MNRLLRAGVVGVLLAGPVANATADDSMIYYHVGSWDAFSGHTDSGQAFCGIGSTNPVDGRSLSVRFDLGSQDVVFTAGKPNWSIPDGTKATVVMQVGSETPWTELAVGNGRRLHWSMDQAAVQSFDLQFRRAPAMTLTFPGGNEPPWTISLNGSTAIDNTFGRCITDLSQREQMAGQAGGPPATQPYGAAAASVPAPARAVPQPTAPAPAPPQAAAPAPVPPASTDTNAGPHP